MAVGKCGLCGKKPAEGFASINGVWYCHGDDDDPTCYMRATVETASGSFLFAGKPLASSVEAEKEGFEPSKAEDGSTIPNADNFGTTA